MNLPSPARGQSVSPILVAALRRVALPEGHGRVEGVGLAIRFLALGDSYTIGTGASSPAHSWPSIIAKRLNEQTGQEVGLTNPAVNGFTTLDLSLIHISEPTRLGMISYAVFCLKKKK